MLQCVAVCCSVLQRVAVCCSVLQCVAVCCIVVQCVVDMTLCLSRLFLKDFEFLVDFSFYRSLLAYIYESFDI